jgi:cytochrome c-type biogenesis protein CcmE
VTPRRARLLLLGVTVAGALLLMGAGLQHTLMFYRTPSEVQQGPAARVRLGGEVVPGSLHTQNGLTSFQLGDGTSRVQVEQVEDLPGTIREGQQAVVEGTLDGQGVFHSDTVMAKHGNEYRPAAGDGGDDR